MQDNGMKPMDAILAATRNIAASFHKLDLLGTLEKGKVADLVVPGMYMGNVLCFSSRRNEFVGRLAVTDALTLELFARHLRLGGA
jgi:predicted amidohydrolase